MNKEGILELKKMIKLHEFYINYWLNSSINGHAQSRKMYHGTSCTEENKFTDQELINESMATAKRHIRSWEQCSENLINLEVKR